MRVYCDGGVEVVAPPRVSPPQIADFVARHRDWIARQQRRAQPLDMTFPPQSLQLPALGQTWEVAQLPSRARGSAAALLEWLTVLAGASLPSQLSELAGIMGVQYRRVQIRRQRTRWGSCSSRGTVSLNVCLLFQPPEVVHYLFVHELTHMRHMNHSERFWSAVAAVEPRWRELDRALTRGWQCVPGWLLAALRA